MSAKERPSKRQRMDEVESIDAQDTLLHTIDRAQLDFDRQVLCSSTLSNRNVYCCLVCGKYYEGRSSNTPAYFHSLDDDHHVFMNLTNLKVYSLPDQAEITHALLEDIKYACRPSYSKTDVLSLDKDSTPSLDVIQTSYHPGFIGLNNRGGFDHIPAVIQVLVHTVPLRNYFLLEDLSGKSDLVQAFALMTRKMWSRKLFRAHVNPQEFVRHCVDRRKGAVDFTKKATEPQEFLTFVLNHLHADLAVGKSSIISVCFQGIVKVETQKIYTMSDAQDGRVRFHEDLSLDTRTLPYMCLALDLPPMPLFQDENQRSIIPQVNLVDLLSKYDGASIRELPGKRQRYSIIKLPPLLIFHIQRFKKSDFSSERNATIVNFPLRSLDMRPYVIEPPVDTIYDLVANVSHELKTSSSGEESHVFRAHVQDLARDTWIQSEGMYVEEIKREVIAIGESVLQIWRRR